jgi:diketogulonate reductase-like aldo/keto reductase
VIARPFGPTGANVPIVGQGSWNIPTRGAAADEAKRALRAGIECGMVHLDTAEMYGDGAAEELIGAAIRGLPRERLFIVSKVLPSNASFAGTIAACDRSLARLGIEYLDCYLLHWRGMTPLRETMRAFELLVAGGKIRALGVSNFDVDDLEEARNALEREPLACNQVLYHLNERTIEDHELLYARRHDIATVAYTPFGRGAYERSAGYPALVAIAKRCGATPRQVVLAFLARFADTFVISKAASAAHARENAAAGDLQLTEADVAAIAQAYPAGRRRGGLPSI